MQASKNAVTTRPQQTGTRYVFAASHDTTDEMTTKVCPRCGEVLFADMDVCYGCLYDFTKDDRGRQPMEIDLSRYRADDLDGLPMGSAPAAVGDRDPLAVIALDEIDDEGEPKVVEEEIGVPPRHGRKSRAAADDTIDFSSLKAASPPPSAAKAPPRQLCVCVQTKEALVRLRLLEGGLMVGRSESNDIVLHSRAVSREHIKLTPLDGKVLVEDRGATNPATVGDKPIDDSVVLGIGDVIEVCGTQLAIEDAVNWDDASSIRPVGL